MENTKRQSAKGNPLIGSMRHDLYADVIIAYNDALKHHYNIEAITIAESLISDRMESLANELSVNKDYSYKTLGELTLFLKGQKIDSFKPVLEKIDDWRKKRNDAIHQLAKQLEPEFRKHYDSTRETAKKGLTLFREFDRLYKTYMRKINKP